MPQSPRRGRLPATETRRKPCHRRWCSSDCTRRGRAPSTRAVRWQPSTAGSTIAARASSMLLCAAGDIHGAIERLYRDVLAFENALGRPFELVLHVGDFGIWPDAGRVDRATREHDGA